MLEVTNLSAAYGRIQAIRNVSLRVQKGSIVALLGANGAGKSTTLNCISGLLRPVSGTIHFEGQDLVGRPSHNIVVRGISQVPEGREIFGDMSVRENLEMGLYLRARDPDARSEFDKITDYFPVLRQRMSQRASTLSGGEQQMLLVARALMAKPKLLMLDEPSLGLSPLLVEQIFDRIVAFAKNGLTILLVEQNAQLALEISEHAYLLENGEMALEGPSAELIEDDRVRSAYLGV